MEYIIYKMIEISKLNSGGDRPKIYSDTKTNECCFPIFSNGLQDEGLYGYTNNATMPSDTITVSARGANIGEVFYRKEDFLPIVRLITIIPDSNYVHSKYLYYYLKKVKIEGSGSAQPQITVPFFSRHKIVIPKDVEYQKKVAYILSAYDNLIENNNKRIKLLEQMAENLYKEWFVRFRFPGYEDVEFIDGFPKKWEKVKLDDVLNKIATGLNPRKNFVLGEGENFYVTIKNMADNTVYLDDKCDKVNDDAIIKTNKRSDLKIGDLLFSGIGTIGRVCLIDIPTNNWNISESIFTMRANKKISSEFLYMLLLSQDVQNYCQSKANGSAQKGIRMGDLRKYTFLLPTKNVINDFANQISPILRNVSLLRNENKNLIQQRDMLLPRLMSGKLEV